MGAQYLGNILVTGLFLLGAGPSAFSGEHFQEREAPARAAKPAEKAPEKDAEKAPEKAPWTCGETQWNKDAEMEDGVFQSDLRMECIVEKSNPKGFLDMANALLDYLGKNRTVHSQSARTEKGGPARGGLKIWTVDTTTKLSEEKESIAIHEIVTITTDGKSRLIFETASRDIYASGLAGYLKRVNFKAVLEPSDQPGRTRVVMHNQVAVERPWFALAPLFFAIAKGVSVDKFSVARDRILPKLVEAL